MSKTLEEWENWKKSGISIKLPSYRKDTFISNHSWLKGKQHDDEAEGLWRIYDNLFDLSAFVSQHPGGSFWLEQTKGTDITEAFETHHIKRVPQALLDKYFVRKATKPRNYTLTLHENGFYRTLKRRVAEELQDLDYGPKRRTYFYHLGLVLATVLFSIASTQVTHSLVFEFLAALCLAWQSIVAHNYFHQRDNWQMYTFNLTLMNFAEWRISHAISHHIYPNSLHDLEMSLLEPFLCWVPNDQIASKARRIVSVLLQPISYAGIFPYHFAQRVVRSIFSKNELYWHDIIGFTLPLAMFLFSPSSPLDVLLTWTRIISCSSFIFGLIAINGSHHSPDIWHDGDALRTDRDWGLYQLDAIIDLAAFKSSHFMALTHFGEHVLHHLFPTLDHGVLPQLYPVFMKTLEEYKAGMMRISLRDSIIGQNQQLLRTKPNPIAHCQRSCDKIY